VDFGVLTAGEIGIRSIGPTTVISRRVFAVGWINLLDDVIS